MIPPPIIIPISNTKKINCIVQEGVRYCEDKQINKQEGAFMAFGVAGLILWFIFWFWISIKIEDKWGIFLIIPIFLGGIVLPAIVIGLVLLF